MKRLILILSLIPAICFGQIHTMPGTNNVPSGATLNIQSGATENVLGSLIINGGYITPNPLRWTWTAGGGTPGLGQFTTDNTDPGSTATIKINRSSVAFFITELQTIPINSIVHFASQSGALSPYLVTANSYNSGSHVSTLTVVYQGTGVSPVAFSGDYSLEVFPSFLVTVANGGTGVTTSTGTGNTVLSNSPALTTPDLGTPSAVTLTNGTGLPAASLTGAVAVANGGTAQTTLQASINSLMAASGALSQGDVFYFNGTNVVRLAAGTSGQFLKTLGASANPAWAAANVAGAPLVVAKNLSLAQNATNSSVAAYTTPNDSTVHPFRVGATAAVTAISAGTLTITATFTDENNASQTVTFFGMGLTSAGITGTGYTAFAPANIWAKPNTAITVVATFTGVSITYDAGAVIESLY